MAVNDSIVSLVEDIVSGLRNTGTIVNETYSNNVLTLELTNLYDLAVNKYITVGSDDYKIIALDSGASTVDVVATSVTGETTYTVSTPFFYNGTMQMINKKINSNNDNYAKYPAICLVDVFQTERVTDPTSVIYARPRCFIAFLKESLQDYGSDLQNPIINEMQDLSEDFITLCQSNPYIGRFDEFTVTRHANFGVYAADRGHISTIIDEQLSGVVLEVTLPVYENFEDCTGNVVSTIKCAPVLIKDSDGNLIATKQAGSTYVVPAGGGDVEIYDTDGNLLYTVTAPASQTIQDSVDRIYLNSVVVFPNPSIIETVNLLAEGTETTIISVENTSGTDVGSVSGGNVVIADSTIENSNGSYSVNLPAEDALNLPDIDLIDLNGVTTQIPSVQDVDISDYVKMSANFQGSTDNFLESPSTDFDFGDEDISICLSFRTKKTSSNQGIIGKWTSGSNASWLVYISGNQFGFALYNGSSATVYNVGTISIDTTYYFACVYDSVANLMKISVNGASFTTTPHNGGANNASTLNLNVGKFSTFGMDGDVDRIAVYGKALSLAEVQALEDLEYSDYSAAQKVDLISFYGFDDITNIGIDSHGVNNLTLNETLGFNNRL